MLLKVPIAVLVVSLFAGAVRCESENSLPLVTGGVATIVGEAPFVCNRSVIDQEEQLNLDGMISFGTRVSIRRQAAVGQANNVYCSGTIINANHVVTAAECTHDATFNLINPFWFRIIAGDLSILNPSFQRFMTRASHIYTHPSYTFTPRRFNIAVIRTLDSFPFPSNNIDFAVRNSIALPVGHDCRFIGWGSQTEAGATLAAQRRVNAPIIERTCGGTAIADHMLCAGSLTATNPISGVCTGNLGGGLFCNVDGRWEFTGVLSFGIGCGAANTPGQYMQVRQFEVWINQQLTRTDATNPGIRVEAPTPAP